MFNLSLAYHALNTLPKYWRQYTARVILGPYFKKFLDSYKYQDYDFTSNLGWRDEHLVLYIGASQLAEPDLKIKFVHRSYDYRTNFIETTLGINDHNFTINEEGNGNIKIAEQHLYYCKTCRNEVYVHLPYDCDRLHECEEHQEYIWQMLKSYSRVLLLDYFIRPATVKYYLSSHAPLPLSEPRFISTVSSIYNKRSRFVFQCIWSLRRGETVLVSVPNDIFRMISEMIWHAE